MLKVNEVQENLQSLQDKTQCLFENTQRILVEVKLGVKKRSLETENKRSEVDIKNGHCMVSEKVLIRMSETLKSTILQESTHLKSLLITSINQPIHKFNENEKIES